MGLCKKTKNAGETVRTDGIKEETKRKLGLCSREEKGNTGGYWSLNHLSMSGEKKRETLRPKGGKKTSEASVI